MVPPEIVVLAEKPLPSMPKIYNTYFIHLIVHQLKPNVKYKIFFWLYCTFSAPINYHFAQKTSLFKSKLEMHRKPVLVNNGVFAIYKRQHIINALVVDGI